MFCKTGYGGLMHPREIKILMALVKETAYLSEEDLCLAEDILDNLGPNRVVLANRAAKESGFVDRLQEHYETQRKKQLKVMDSILTTRKMPTDRQEQLRKTYEELKELEFGEGKLAIKNHYNNEIYERSLSNVRGRHVDLIGLLGWDTLHSDWKEIQLMGDLLLRAGVEKVDLYLPYLPYQREDKKDEGRVPIAAKQIFNDIKNAFLDKLDRLVTFELHAPQSQGYLDIPVDHLNCNNLFANYILSEHFQEKYASKDYVVVSPDVGHAKPAKKFAEILGVDYVIIDKGRAAHGEASVNDRNIEEKVKNRICLLIDDMCDTGGTLIKAYHNIMSYGASGVVALAGHAIFSPKEDKIPAEQKLKECGIHVVVTDTIPRFAKEHYKQNEDWLTVLTVTKKLAKVMIANRLNSSVGAVIDRNRSNICTAREKKEMMYIEDVVVRY